MEKDRYLLSSVNNTLSLLELFAHHSSLSLAELSRMSSFDKASLFRMLYTLEKNGFVIKNEDARYSLGLKLLHYGGLVAARQDVITQAKPFMQEFSQRTGLAAHLGRLSQGRVVTVHIEDPPYDIQVTARVGMNAPAYSTAMGRVLLAYLPKEEYETLCQKFSFKQYSSASVKNADELTDLLGKVRRQGWAMDLDERFPGFGSLAVPVFDYSGRCVAAVGLVTLAQNVRQNQLEYCAHLMELAPDISHALGYIPKQKGKENK